MAKGVSQMDSYSLYSALLLTRPYITNGVPFGTETLITEYEEVEWKREGKTRQLS